MTRKLATWARFCLVNLILFVCAAAHGTSSLDSRKPLIDSLLDLDREYAVTETRSPRPFLEAHAQRVHACGTPRVEIVEQWFRCALDALLGVDGLKPSPDPNSLVANSATSALSSHEGSCAALVAAVLALTEPFGEPFDAAVLRDHVVLGLRSAPGVYFEVLEGGRQLNNLDLRRHRMPPGGKPTRVLGHEYLAYYLDNLAARLADGGDTAKAERALVKALEIAPKSGRVHYNYGTLLLRTERFKAAEAHLKLAIRLGWDDADAWVSRGVAVWKLGRLRGAERSFEKALAREPGNQRATSNLAALRNETAR